MLVLLKYMLLAVKSSSEKRRAASRNPKRSMGIIFKKDITLLIMEITPIITIMIPTGGIKKAMALPMIVSTNPKMISFRIHSEMMEYVKIAMLYAKIAPMKSNI